MAANTQVLLSLCCVISITKCHVFYPNLHHGYLPGLGQFDKPNLPIGLPDNDELIDDNSFSYLARGFNPYNRDFSPTVSGNPYFAYPRIFNKQNFYSTPDVTFGLSDGYNEILKPDLFKNRLGGKNNADEIKNETEDKKLSEKKNTTLAIRNDDKEDKKVDSPNGNIESKTFEYGTRPDTYKVKNINSPKNTADNKTEFTANKDYFAVDNNKNKVYLLHENLSKSNIFITNADEPIISSLAYVPYNTAQNFWSQFYSGINSLPLSANYPIATNNVNFNSYNNIMIYPSQSSPSSVLIYAHGHIFQIPDILSNPPKSNQDKNFVIANDQNSNISIVQNTINSKYGTFLNAPNRLVSQVPNTAGPIPIQNPNADLKNQIILNPNLWNNEPRVQPYAESENNIIEDHHQPNFGKQNTVSPKVLGYTNNPAIHEHSTVAFLVDNNPSIYQQLVQEKEAVEYPPNNVQLLNPTSNSTAPVKTDSKKNVYLSNVVETQHPAIIPRFKETENKNNGKWNKSSEENNSKKEED